MKFTKWMPSVTAFFLLLSLSAVSMAQSAGPTGGSVKPTTQSRPHGQGMLREALKSVDNMTKDERKQIADLVKKTGADNKAFRQAHQGDKAALRAHAKESMENLMKSIKGILTPAQFTQFDAKLKELREQNHKNGKHAPAKPA